jgi:hypothetical protein
MNERRGVSPGDQGLRNRKREEWGGSRAALFVFREYERVPEISKIESSSPRQ